jgi:hypothetical protein
MSGFGPVMPDILLLVVISASFAMAATAHVAILMGLVRRKYPWQALSGLLMPPLAIYWAYREEMRTRSTLWLVGVLVYGATLTLALWRG